MEINEILSHVDHTLLAVDAAWEDIRAIVDDGIRFGTASVCIPPSFVKQAAEYAQGRVPVCTVIGFPNGYSVPEAKYLEAAAALRDGADEVDTVINVGWVKDGRYGDVLRELTGIRAAMDAVCPGKILKVIIECCLLTEEEKIRLCKIVSDCGCEYIKTSTGFSKGGATREDVALLRANVAPEVKVKAAGGISSLQDAEDFINLGAERLGTSRIVKLAMELEHAEGAPDEKY